MRSRIKKLPLLSIVMLPLLAGGFYLWLMQDFLRSNSMLIHNGTVITMEPDAPTVEAVFVKQGRIAAVGTFDELAKLREPDTETIDLQEKRCCRASLTAILIR